jgi:hypothetical protein
MNFMPLEVSKLVNLQFSTIGTNNIADSRTYEVGTTLATVPKSNNYSNISNNGKQY